MKFRLSGTGALLLACNETPSSENYEVDTSTTPEESTSIASSASSDGGSSGVRGGADVADETGEPPGSPEAVTRAIMLDMLGHAGEREYIRASARSLQDSLECLLSIHGDATQSILEGIEEEVIVDLATAQDWGRLQTHLGGLVYELSPIDEWATKCTEELVAGPDFQFASRGCADPCAADTDVAFVYANGMFVDFNSAISQLGALTLLATNSPLWSAEEPWQTDFATLNVSWSLAYNQNQDGLSQLIEVCGQAFGLCAAFVPLWPDAATEEDLACHVEMYTSCIDRGADVVVAAHSQGNFFANAAVDRLREDDVLTPASMAVLGIANPDSRVAPTFPFSTWISVLDDAVVGLVPFHLPATEDNDAVLGEEDPKHHALVDEYLNGSHTRGAIEVSWLDLAHTLQYGTGYAGEVEGTCPELRFPDLGGMLSVTIDGSGDMEMQLIGLHLPGTIDNDGKWIATGENDPSCVFEGVVDGPQHTTGSFVCDGCSGVFR